MYSKSMELTAQVKRQKNDAAEAICEAALRSSMRFVPVKSKDVQGAPWSSGSGSSSDIWTAKMLAEKPFRLATVAMANKSARIIWAMRTKRKEYRQPIV